jgi:hypothetical protein
MLQGLAEQLAGLPLSETLKSQQWIVPAVQSVHILALAVILSSVAMLDLRVLSMRTGGATGAELDRRFLRWVWPSLAVMLATGAVLILAEPDRSLPNEIFQLKMLMLLGAIGLSLLMVRSLGVGAITEIAPGRRMSARVLAALSLVLWLSVAVAGRWIAYWEG